MSPYHGLDDKIKNKNSSGMEFSDVDLESTVGRSQISSTKAKDFLDLDLINSKYNSYRMTIHLDYLPPSS